MTVIQNTSHAKEDILRLLSLADGSDPRMTDYVRAVLSVSIIVNEETVEEIKEAGIMPEAVRRLFKEEFEAERNAGRMEGREEGRMEGREEGREEGRMEVYKRMRAANIPEERACYYAYRFFLERCRIRYPRRRTQINLHAYCL